MRRIILGIVIVLMLSTPCLAQEIEPERLFSFHGTRWLRCYMSVQIPMGFGEEVDFYIGCDDHSVGYYKGKVFTCDLEGVDCIYHEKRKYPTRVFIDYVFKPPTQFYGERAFGLVVRIILPIGFGFETGFHRLYEKPTGWITYNYLGYFTGLYFKIDNNWIAPSIIYEIWPDKGETGTTLTLHILGIDTTFQDNPPVEITFDPPDGLTVSAGKHTCLHSQLLGIGSAYIHMCILIVVGDQVAGHFEGPTARVAIGTYNGRNGCADSTWLCLSIWL